ncbi:MAG: ATP-binding protein [Gammaproteobacteria bacterium]|nr:ATP-binding protein [Gammaproteobacteria bacterium]
MLAREAFELVNTRLMHFDSVALIGPRQVGKTTLARQIAGEWSSGAKYLDLENPADRRLLDDPAAYLSTYASQLIVLDEIHRAPEIFQVLRGQIDERRRMPGETGRFLILGSASIDLLRQSSENLAGRISYVELAPFTTREVSRQSSPSEDSSANGLDRLWVQGGFPPSYLRDDESVSLRWRTDFIQTYLERDLPQFGLQVSTDRMDLFWRMISNDQGELFNAQRYARSLGVSGHTVSHYLDVLHKLLMLRVLRPWYANTGKRLVKSPRPYVRDSGILHALLGLRTMDDLLSHPVAGKSWEGFVIENLISSTTGRANPYFYRTGAGAEIDLVLEFAPGKCWAIEIKLSSAPTVDRGFYNATDDIGAERRILVHKGKDLFPMRHGVEAMPLHEAMNEVSAALNE